MEGTDTSSFDLDGSSGQLKTNAELDHETKSSYSVVVKVTDPSKASDSITVTVTVADVEEAPVFPSSETGARRCAREHGSWSEYRPASGSC